MPIIWVERGAKILKSREEVEGISDGITAILIIVSAVVLVCIALLLSVIKLVNNTNKDIVAKLSLKTEVKDAVSETSFQIKASDKKEKQ